MSSLGSLKSTHPEAAAAFEKWQKWGPFGSKTDVSTDYVAVAE
jgi:hypothetical protein